MKDRGFSNLSNNDRISTLVKCLKKKGITDLNIINRICDTIILGNQYKILCVDKVEERYFNLEKYKMYKLSDHVLIVEEIKLSRSGFSERIIFKVGEAA